MKKVIFKLLLILFLFPTYSKAQDNVLEDLKKNTWGLHSITKIDSVEFFIPLGDSDSRITFNSNGTLKEYDSGIERIYRWTLIEGLELKIIKMESNNTEPWSSSLKLEKTDKIDKIDNLNLILITNEEDGVVYRYHYMKFN